MPIALPVLDLDRPMRFAPTDITQFVRLEQCERYLRFRLAERAGQDVMRDYEVTPQRITPLLTLSGSTFEESVASDLPTTIKQINFAHGPQKSGDRLPDHAALLAAIASLAKGDVLVLFQTRLEAERDGWLLRGDVDILRLERTTTNQLRILVSDMKSTVQVKIEHRLQVIFYRLMLETLLQQAGIDHEPVQTGILFRPPAAPTPERHEELQPCRIAAQEYFGTPHALLEVLAQADAYVQSAYDLVLKPDSLARQIARTPFEEVPFHLGSKCDGCLYNEFCMKWSAETEDLSLLPYIAKAEKDALWQAGVRTVPRLAKLKEFAPDVDGTPNYDLVTVPAHEATVKQLAATWSVGPHLDELIHRAKAYCGFFRKDGTRAHGFIPGQGNSTLPVCNDLLHPNLVYLFIDAQQDYLEERLYLLGGLIVAHEHGKPLHTQAIVELADGPPEKLQQEQELFLRWTQRLVRGTAELAVSGAAAGEPKTAPIHVVFFNRYEQRILLEALARNFPPLLKQTPPLYDFLTQLAAFDSPIATYLDEELRAFKNYPLTCQSLQSLAQYTKFNWNSPRPFRDLFKTRLFDNIGKLKREGDTNPEQEEWYTRRARFGSTIPLEYAYAVWKQLPTPQGKSDEFSGFRRVQRDDLLAFQQRRLEAMQHVMGQLRGNANTTKTPFNIPDVAQFEDKAETLAQAMHEFITIERLVELNDWKATRHAPAERRVLMGETLVVRYIEADQSAEIAEKNRDNQRRKIIRDGYLAAKTGKRMKWTDAQKVECAWSMTGMRFKLHVEAASLDCDLHEALLLSSLREGDTLILYPRWSVDERLPVAEQVRFSPTPKQMLYGQRIRLVAFHTVQTDERVTDAWIEIECPEALQAKMAPFVFNSIERPLEADELYTLDPCPNSIYAYWCNKVVEGLCDHEPHVLYERLQQSADTNARGYVGQQVFLQGLDAFHEAELLHDFEPSKRSYIGEYGATRLLLVQGPPGTGKSYSTAFAVFARLQAAMCDGRPYRVYLTCKTHAATDVLLNNVRDVQQVLRTLQQANPALFARYFHADVLTVPLFRIAGPTEVREGIIPLTKDTEKAKDEPSNAEILAEHNHAIVGTTPGGTYGLVKAIDPKALFGHQLCDLLVLDEASQMNLPEAMLAALPLKDDASVIVVGDHRQMPPIIKHDWDRETRRTFQQFRVYESLFDTLRAMSVPIIRFAESFRLHRSMAEFLRQEVYAQDGIAYHSHKSSVLPTYPLEDALVAAVLTPEYPLIVVTHTENASQVRNPFEQCLVDPILRTLANPALYHLRADEGLGIVVPHRAQRAALQQAFPELCIIDPHSGLPTRSAIDTVERFQGDERTVILVSATESDRAYLLASSTLLLDPRRLTVAISRAKQKIILVAAENIFNLFSTDEVTFANALLWKSLLRGTCRTLLWQGAIAGRMVHVWGGPP